MSETVTVPVVFETGKLVAALAKARAAVQGIRKNRENPHLKAAYANLIAYIDASVDALSDNGLVLTQLPEPTSTGWALRTRLMHESGQFIESILPLACPPADAQKFGSCLTYMRRYAMTAMLNLSADEDDDDGHQAAGKGHQRPQQQVQQQARREPEPKEPDAPPPREFTIKIPGKPDEKRAGEAAFVKAWRGLAKQAPTDPDKFRKLAEANYATFDALCKDGCEAVVSTVSDIIKAALGE